MHTIKKSLQILKRDGAVFPRSLVILGSGWDAVLKGVYIQYEVEYDELFGIKTTVPGHSGKLIIGTLNKKKVAFMSGRFHMYEGFSGYEATFPIRVFAKMGIQNLIVTAACGGLNPSYKVGDIVILNDVITLLLSLDSPLIGPEFIDTSCVFDTSMRNKAVTICKNNGFPYQTGSYVYYHGPNFETPSDKRALRILGADVCGMSTVPETLVARSLGIDVLGLSFVTNLAFVKHDHKEVLQEAEKGSNRMKKLITEVLS